MKKCLSILLFAFNCHLAFADEAPICRVYSANSEEKTSQIISVSVNCEGYGDWTNVSPNAKLEAIIVSPAKSSKTFAVNARGFVAVDIPMDLTYSFNEYVIKSILAQDPSIKHVDYFLVLRATFEAGTKVYSDIRLSQEVKKKPGIYCLAP